MNGSYLGLCRILVLVGIALTLSLAAAAQTESILYSFTASTDGGLPFGGVILDSKGNLYGTAEVGGANNAGAVFELSPNSSGGWTEQVIYSFNGFANTNDGAAPLGGLVFDGKGNLYGTTLLGGTYFEGTVFELSPGSNGTWNEKVIYDFAGGTSAGQPQGNSLAIDGAGNLYGLAPYNCTSGFGCVFELVAGANGAWTLKILHAFTGDNDGSGVYGSSLTIDSAGNLYGTTSVGGQHDYGVLYKLTPQSNGTWSEKVLYSFNAANGVSEPIGKLALDSTGNIYGTAYPAVFELSPGANGAYSEKSLHVFGGGKDGAIPESGVVFDSAGNIYGTTYTGGAHRGTVFELSPGSNGTWTEKVLHSFSSTGGDAVFPTLAPLSIDGQGHVYGTTPSGGASGHGVVYEVTP